MADTLDDPEQTKVAEPIEQEPIEEPEPQYAIDQREARRQAEAAGGTLSDRKMWEAAARLSRERIAAKYPNKKRLN